MRIFVTHIAPREIGRKNGISVAATNFSYNLISGKVFDRVFSILPPYVPKLNPRDLKDNDIFISNSFIRRLNGKLAAIIEQFDLFWRIPKKSDVWFYNISALNKYLIKLLRIFKPSVKIYAIVLDYTPDDSKAIKMLPIINSANGRILLSQSDIFNKNNSCCLPGVVPASRDGFPKIETIGNRFLISGQLSDNISMLSDLLQIFSNMPELELNISGKIPEVSKSYASKYSNIRIHENLKFEQYIELLHSCPFLLSTRDPRFPENSCNFPSKIIEGLLHNRIIISTIDYPQLTPLKYLKVDALNLQRDIDKIARMSQDELLLYANQSALTYHYFNTEVWLRKMTEIEKFK